MQDSRVLPGAGEDRVMWQLCNINRISESLGYNILVMSFMRQHKGKFDPSKPIRIVYDRHEFSKLTPTYRLFPPPKPPADLH